jgi:hypothetical protein
VARKIINVYGMVLLGVLASGAAAYAAGTIDATHYTVSCDTLSKGSVGFKPALFFGGAAPSSTKLKGTLSGCVATPDGTNPAVTVISGSVSGLLTTPNNDCGGLVGPSATTGMITIKWKTTPALANATTTITVASGNVSGGTAAPLPPDTAQYGLFTISGTSQTGAFGGASGTGALSTTRALTVQGIINLATNCAPPPAKGLKAVNLGPTSIILK